MLLKPRLKKMIKELFEIGGNHDSNKDIELREQLLYFSKE